MTGGSGPEGGEIVRAVCHDGYAPGLQNLKRLGNVEDRLGAGADDDNGCLRQLLEICRNVEALLRATMNAADPAGCEDIDAGEGSRNHGGGDRGGSGAAECHCKSQIGA